MSPGLKTEFFEQMSMDFCADLKNWTALLLATDDVPLVHSVSYGWQGNLSQVQCTPDKTTAIDAGSATLWSEPRASVARCDAGGVALVRRAATTR